MLRVILPTKASGHGCRSGSAAFEQVIGPQQKLMRTQMAKLVDVWIFDWGQIQP